MMKNTVLVKAVIILTIFQNYFTHFCRQT